MSKFTSKKIGLGVIGAAVVVAVTYIALSAVAQSEAEEQVQAFEKMLGEATHQTKISTGDVNAGLFSGSATIDDFAMKQDVTGNRLAVDKLTIVPEDDRLKHFAAKNAALNIDGSGDVVKVDRFALDDVSYNDLEMIKLIFEGEASQREIDEFMLSVSTGAIELTGASVSDTLTGANASGELETFSVDSIAGGVIHGVEIASGEFRDTNDSVSGQLESLEAGAVVYSHLIDPTITPEDFDARAAAEWTVDRVSITNGEATLGVTRMGIDNIKTSNNRVTAADLELDDLYLERNEGQSLRSMDSSLAQAFSIFDTDRFSMSAGSSTQVDYENGDLDFEVNYSVSQVGSVTMKGDLAGIPYERFENLNYNNQRAFQQTMQQAMMAMGVRDLSARYEDDGAIDKLAEQMGGRQAMARLVEQNIAAARGALTFDDQQMIGDAMTNFIDGGDTISISIDPDRTMGITEIQRAAASNVTLIESMGLRVEGE